MKWRQLGFRRAFACVLLPAIAAFCCAQRSQAQGNGYERTFLQSKATVEKALKDMQAATAGRLPVLSGFATSSDHPVDHYQRGYYQSKFQVSTAPSGGSVVRVSVQVTAWYVDPVAARSGYQVLTSNGRLEADLLDQLADQLAGKGTLDDASPPASAGRKPFPSEKSASGQSSSKQLPEESLSGSPAKTPDPAGDVISAPVPRLPETGGGFSSSLAQSLAEQEKASRQTEQKKPADKNQSALQAEAESLEEILKNQAHPKNLVAVKKSATAVVATPSLTAKTLFLASAHDEFEMLDFNSDWVHVRMSGLSRGWIWRNSVEMPDGISDVDTTAGSARRPTVDDLFHVAREETAPFPGDWEPLRNKNVKIISVQKTDESAKGQGPEFKLEFAKSLLDKSYAGLEKKSDELAGIVLIFDSADGGMIATTANTLQEWKAGKLSDSALWHQSYFDPPETFGSAAPSASQ
jgi:hypothetical protein